MWEDILAVPLLSFVFLFYIYIYGVLDISTVLYHSPFY